MNNKFTLLALFAFSSFAPIAATDWSLRNDLDYCECDCRDTDRSVQSDIGIVCLYLLSQNMPDKYNCKFDPRGRMEKVATTYALNNYLLQNSLDVSVDTASGKIYLVKTDEALEVGYVALRDLVNEKPTSDILFDSGKTFVREKIVSTLLWLIDQTKIEKILPDSLTTSLLYDLLVKEIARYSVDTLVINQIVK